MSSVNETDYSGFPTEGLAEDRAKKTLGQKLKTHSDGCFAILNAGCISISICPALTDDCGINNISLFKAQILMNKILHFRQ